MKCYNHDNNDAVAICAHCGKALCRNCTSLISEDKIVCGKECADQVFYEVEMLKTIRKKTLSQNKAGAYAMFILAFIFGIAGIIHLFIPGFRGLGIILLAIATGSIVSGFIMRRVATKKE